MIIKVDNSAWASGVWTSGITGIGAILTTPEGASAWQWIAGLVITGLFGVASSAVTVIVRYYLTNRKKDKD